MIKNKLNTKADTRTGVMGNNNGDTAATPSAGSAVSPTRRADQLPPSPFQSQEKRKVPNILDVDPFVGLSDVEVSSKLQQYGHNELPTQKHRKLFTIAIEVLKEPMFLMLVAAGLLYLLMGEPTDAMMLLFFVFVIMTITIVQEQRTERALDALRDLSSPRALVIRNGKHLRIPGREVVPGDIMVLAEGDRVPADAILRQSLNLTIDESLLTGESVPVRKAATKDAICNDKPGGDDLATVFSGTLVTAGQGLAEVTATGVSTELGKIGKSLESVKAEPTPLQGETNRLVRTFAIAGLLACVVVVVVYAVTRGGTGEDWNQGLLAGIAMAMAILPEEFPVVLTVFLALGAWRISRNQVLTRRMPAVETLGAATVLCVDKTGTLTQNVMTLRFLVTNEDHQLDLTTLVNPGTGASNEAHVGVDAAPSGVAASGSGADDWAVARAAAGINTGATADADDNADAETPSLPEKFHGLLEFPVLASKSDPFDPMERAIHRAGNTLLKNTEHLHPQWNLLKEYPLSPQLLAVSNVWHTEDTASTGLAIVASKGAPEAIADLCHMHPAQRDALAARVSGLAAEGIRVLGVAWGTVQADRLPLDHHDLELHFLGLLGLEDPLRPEVPDAVEECRTAGIRVVMITGDFPATATSVARQAGILRTDKMGAPATQGATSGRHNDAPTQVLSEGPPPLTAAHHSTSSTSVITGPELDHMSDDELAKRIGNVRVFARVVPEQKLRIVKALKAEGEVVAMTGDGVNDAPALKAAHIGIAMGGRGTDVAREAASLVLLDDDFASIVAAVRMGRRIFDNIRKAITFILAVHVPIAGLSIIPVFFGSWPLLLLPVHIVFLELIIDPSCSLIFEAEKAEKGLMSRPPRKSTERLFSSRTATIAILQGLGILVACLLVFQLTRHSQHSDEAARALTFTTLVISILGTIMVNRSWSKSIFETMRTPNRVTGWVTIGTLLFLAIVLFVPVAMDIFHFKPVHGVDLVYSVMAGLLAVMVFEVYKWVGRRRGKCLKLS